MNSDNIINGIIKEIREESQKRYKEVSTFKKLKNGNFKDENKIIYLWDNFDIENDISENYFMVLFYQSRFTTIWSNEKDFYKSII